MPWLLRVLPRSSRRNLQQFTQRRQFKPTTVMSTASTGTVLYAAAISASQLTSAVPEGCEDLAHHAKGRKGFVNPWASYQELGAPRIGGILLWRLLSGKANKPDTTPPTVPIRKPEFLSTRETAELRATWLGHACYHIEFPGGLRVLFDPVWEGRLEDIATIDLVIISHAHYDHLSRQTLTKIKKLHPRAHFFVPLGNKKSFVKSGLHNVTELDWWQSRDVRLSLVENAQPKAVDGANSHQTARDITATVECLPCQHMAARTLFDKAHTLWASWCVSSGGKKVWFAGDTGYRTVPQLPKGEDDYGPAHQELPTCPAFKQIGKLRGPFDLGLIPIGAYEPRYVMSPVHSNPFDSVNIFVDTQCRRALAMHWGTWVLTEEDVFEPPRLLKEALAGKGISEEGTFDVCDIGETRAFS